VWQALRIFFASQLFPAALCAAGASPSFYETRAIRIAPERVAQLAQSSYWSARLQQQSELTLLGDAPLRGEDREAMLAGISGWLAASTPLPASRIFAMPSRDRPGALLFAGATLQAGGTRPRLALQLLAPDRHLEMSPPPTQYPAWPPRHAVRAAGFLEGLQTYCEKRAPVCAALFGWVDEQPDSAPASTLLTLRTEVANASFLVELPEARNSGGPILIRFVGETEPSQLQPPPGFADKVAADLQLESLRQPAAGDVIGAVRDSGALARSERAATRLAGAALFESGTRDAEADLILPAGPGGERTLFTLRILPGSNDVAVERIAPAAEAFPEGGPKPDIRRIPGFPARADTPALRAWLAARYPGMRPRGNTVAEIVASAERIIGSQADKPAWFARNYALAILEPAEADKRLRDVHARPLYRRGGLKRFSAGELRVLESVLQSMSHYLLARLRGTALVRQEADEEANPFGDLGDDVLLAGHTFTRWIDASGGRETTTTVVIYDAAHANGALSFVGGREDDGALRVHSTLAFTLAHEFGHVIAERSSTQRSFLRWAEDLGIAPFTRYATFAPAQEFFAEAFALYLLDPQWARRAHPRLFARMREDAEGRRAGR
jgi:hypothetical protein